MNKSNRRDLLALLISLECELDTWDRANDPPKENTIGVFLCAKIHKEKKALMSWPETKWVRVSKIEFHLEKGRSDVTDNWQTGLKRTWNDLRTTFKGFHFKSTKHIFSDMAFVTVVSVVGIHQTFEANYNLFSEHFFAWVLFKGEGGGLSARKFSPLLSLVIKTILGRGALTQKGFCKHLKACLMSQNGSFRYISKRVLEIRRRVSKMKIFEN